MQASSNADPPLELKWRDELEQVEWTLDTDGNPVRKDKREGLPNLAIAENDVFLFEYLSFHKLLPPHMHLYLDGFRSELEKKVWENYNDKFSVAEFDLHDQLHVAHFEEAFQADFFPRLPGDKLGKPTRSWSRRNSVKVIKDGNDKAVLAFYNAVSKHPVISLPMHEKTEEGRELNPWIPFLVSSFVCCTSYIHLHCSFSVFVCAVLQPRDLRPKKAPATPVKTPNKRPIYTPTTSSPKWFSIKVPEYKNMSPPQTPSSRIVLQHDPDIASTVPVIVSEDQQKFASPDGSDTSQHSDTDSSGSDDEDPNPIPQSAQHPFGSPAVAGTATAVPATEVQMPEVEEPQPDVPDVSDSQEETPSKGKGKGKGQAKRKSTADSKRVGRQLRPRH
jgi:hypothetical protein